MRKKTLLLISSSQVFRDLTKKRLERAGYIIICAADLAEAKIQYEENIPDGILVESELPDGNGFDFCRKTRKGCSAPIMFLSHSKDDELQALHSGANDFLKKPYDYEILKARIAVMLNTKVGLPRDDFDDNETFENDMGAPAKKLAAVKQEMPEPEKEKTAKSGISNIKTIRQLYMFAAACLIVMISAIGMYAITGNTPEYIDPANEEEQEVGFIFSEKEPYTVTKDGMKIPNLGEVLVIAGLTEAYIYLHNPQENSCLLGYEIQLKDTAETIYLSEMIWPGESVGNVTLTRGLAKGEYGAAVKIVVYAADDLAVIDELEIPLQITAH